MVFGAHCYVIDSSFDAHFFKEGFVGVSFFFVLSGFIIAYNYQEKLLEKTATKRTFWVARLARIYPLHLLTLLIAVCIGGYVQYSGTADWIKHFAASTFLLQPFFPSADYFFSFNSPSWSLGTVVLFLLSSDCSFLAYQKKPVYHTAHLSSNYAGRHVSDQRGANQSILVCKSIHPPA
jgi:peptidoglycan/LPS O-acetylase OafA/YrhL